MPFFTEDVPATKQEVTGFECNKCKSRYDSSDFIENQEAFVWRMAGGYGSVWGDGVAVEVVLCQRCAYELLSEYSEEFCGGLN